MHDDEDDRDVTEQEGGQSNNRAAVIDRSSI